MKFDDAVNGVLAILFGAAIIVGSRGMPQVAHIEYGPGFFPGIAGMGLILAGASLVLRRILAGVGAVEGLVQLRSVGGRGVIGFFLVLGSILGYVLLARMLGFLIVAPIFLFLLILWFERRTVMALVGALIGTIVFHTFFYQFMSAPLPWGLLEPWAGRLTW
jgi:putative tricarboxylic transport membrane protein